MFQWSLTISRFAVMLMAGAIVAGSVGCGSQSALPPPPHKTLTSIQITPANPLVGWDPRSSSQRSALSATEAHQT
jgi:hypothetical protein